MTHCINGYVVDILRDRHEMTTKGFGLLLIVIGSLLVFYLFSISDWQEGRTFLGNIRWASVYESGCTYLRYGKICDETIPLGTMLLIPFALISLGLIINREALPENVTIKILPFLRKKDQEAQ